MAKAFAVVVPAQLALPLEDLAVGRLPRQQLQARFDRVLLGRVRPGTHGGVEQAIVDVNVGAHDVYENA